jgi:hypothetical protein
MTATEPTIAEQIVAMERQKRLRIHLLDDDGTMLDAILATLRSVEALQRRITELEPGSDCWDALCKCYRITFMGSAGLGAPNSLTAPFDPKGYAHLTLNLWTSTEPPPGHTGDEQDKVGRLALSKFIEVALRNRAAMGASAGEPL